MRDDIKAEKARKERGLVVWLHITILVTLIVLEERLDAGMFTIFVALTTCSFVALTALQRKYSDGENERATPKQMALAAGLGILVVVAAILLKNLLHAIA
ncbi:hypothetical protein [Collinsella stercoris]|uniref:hypothetical protein n=1 Tax=Collinsella stercoris TaxID=147206 RepID=UPI0023F50F77|nr:hypothetical protein [Collinsella stercoris]